MIITTAANKRNGERDGLLIKALFDSCLRVSELLSITPAMLNNGRVRNVENLKHGGEHSDVAISHH